MPQPLRQSLLISAAIHATVAFLFWLSPQFHLGFREPTKMTMIRLSKGDGGTNTKANQKNLKSLPQSSIREQKSALRELAQSKTGTDTITKPSETKTKTNQPKVNSQQKVSKIGGVDLTQKTPKKTGNKMEDALARINQQLDAREVEIGAAQARKEETGQSPFGGEDGTTSDPQLILYYNQIKQKINREWIVAKSEFSGALVTKILVMIDANGNILRTQLSKSSNDVSFDESAKRALMRAAPFPIPPDSIRDEALGEGFEIEFNPNAVTGRL